ncbi:MAG: DNA repair protein RecO [bacterium]|nr:DNA repair protein RecO [bacterium]
MSTLVRDTAIVLRCIPYSETSLILTVFTVHYGKLGLMYKGGRRKVKTGTALAIEPGYEIDVVWTYKASRELQLVRELTLNDSHYAIRESLESMAIGGALVELLLRSLSDEDPHPELFAGAQRVLRECETATPARWPVFWKNYIVLLDRLGFALSETQLALRGPARLGPESAALMRRLLAVDFEIAGRLRCSPQAEREITRFLSDYLSEHLHAPAQPRTIDALHWVRRTSS